MPLITLSIALIGGIPGILQLMQFFNKTSAKINFDSDNSRFIPISSHNTELDGKTALILLRIQIVGAGEKDSHIAGITTSVYYRNEWIHGVRLYPKLGEETDSEGTLRKYISILHKRDGDTNVLTYLNWREFEPGRYVLGYGEATAFSYACRYDIPAKDRFAISKLRVRVYDYLGNSYQTVVKAESMMLERLIDVVLIAD
jgi:hypothetical protein